MKTSLLMVTFRRDLEFADYAFRLAKKFTTGFTNNVVVVPEQDGEMFREIAEPAGFTVKTFMETPECGFNHHMALICEADQWCPEADVITHFDADCMFTGPVAASDYFLGGKPILYRQRYESFRVQHPNRYGWKACVRNATGIDPEWETMCRHPAVHWRDTYRRTREAIQRHTGMDWKSYILAQRNTYPQGFAEFPTLGAVALAETPELYHWIDPSRPEEIGPDKSQGKMKDFWSRGGLEMINDRHPDQTARQVIEEILAT